MGFGPTQRGRTLAASIQNITLHGPCARSVCDITFTIHDCVLYSLDTLSCVTVIPENNANLQNSRVSIKMLFYYAKTRDTNI